MTNKDNDWLYHLQWTAALYDRDYAGACEILHRWSRRVFAWPWSHMLRSLAYGITYDLWDRPVEARPWLIESNAQLELAIENSEDDPRLFVALGEVLAALGDSENALCAARHALEMRQRTKDAYLSLVYQLDAVLRVFIRADAIDEALLLLDDYLSTRGAAWTIEGLLPDPRLDPIREDRRFLALVTKHQR